MNALLRHALVESEVLRTRLAETPIAHGQRQICIARMERFLK